MSNRKLLRRAAGTPTPVVLMKWTFTDYVRAGDLLHNAVQYLARQFSNEMPHKEAQAHIDARALLIRSSMYVLKEAEMIFGGKR